MSLKKTISDMEAICELYYLEECYVTHIHKAQVLHSMPVMVKSLKDCISTLKKVNLCKSETEAWVLSSKCLKRIGALPNE